MLAKTSSRAELVESSVVVVALVVVDVLVLVEPSVVGAAEVVKAWLLDALLSVVVGALELVVDSLTYRRSMVFVLVEGLL